MSRGGWESRQPAWIWRPSGCGWPMEIASPTTGSSSPLARGHAPGPTRPRRRSTASSPCAPATMRRACGERLAAKPRRVLVIGGGFTGSEIASVCRELGPAGHAHRTRDRAAGGRAGRVRSPRPRPGCSASTAWICAAQTTVTALEGDAQGRFCRARLSDGGAVDADVAVVALGAIRNTEWLRGAGSPSAPSGSPATPGAAPSTSTPSSSMMSSSPATSRASRIPSSTTSLWRWSIGATRWSRPRSPRTT